MTTEFLPLFDRVLVQRAEVEEMTKGGLHIPTSSQEKPLRGKVIAIGDGVLLENGDVRPVSVDVGEMVLFGKHSGSTISIDGEEFILLREEEIFGIIREAA